MGFASLNPSYDLNRRVSGRLSSTPRCPALTSPVLFGANRAATRLRVTDCLRSQSSVAPGDLKDRGAQMRSISFVAMATAGLAAPVLAADFPAVPYTKAPPMVVAALY